MSMTNGILDFSLTTVRKGLDWFINFPFDPIGSVRADIDAGGLTDDFVARVTLCIFVGFVLQVLFVFPSNRIHSEHSWAERMGFSIFIVMVWVAYVFATYAILTFLDVAAPVSNILVVTVSVLSWAYIITGFLIAFLHLLVEMEFRLRLAMAKKGIEITQWSTQWVLANILVVVRPICEYLAHFTITWALTSMILVEIFGLSGPELWKVWGANFLVLVIFEVVAVFVMRLFGLRPAML